MELLTLQQHPLLLLLLLRLQLLLPVSAEVWHRGIGIVACSDLEGEFLAGLDGEMIGYADWEKKALVYPTPDFVKEEAWRGLPDPWGHAIYPAAVRDQITCRKDLQFFRENVKDEPQQLDPPGAPLLYPKDHLLPSQPNTLVCQASGFFPAPVNFSWTRGGVNVSSSSVSQPYPHSDGSFSQLSTLHILPQPGEEYSCSVEHEALRGERRSRIWRAEFQTRSLAPSVFCAVGLIVGLVGVALGTYFLVKGNECR